MKRFAEGDRVRVDTPDETEPDHDRLHGETGVITEIRTDAVNSRDNYLFFSLTSTQATRLPSVGVTSDPCESELRG